MIIISIHNSDFNVHPTELYKDEMCLMCLMKWESKRPCLKELLSTEYVVDKNYKEEGT